MASSGGAIYGATDKHAGYVVDHYYKVESFGRTLYHLLGIDPELEIHDRLGRPYPIGGIGRVRGEMRSSSGRRHRPAREQ